MEQEKIEQSVVVGTWYYVKTENYKGEKYESFSCVTHVGSNYVQFEDPFRNDLRIHFNEFHERCKLVEDPQKVILDNATQTRDALRLKMNAVQELVKELGFTSAQEAAGSSERALVPLKGQVDLKRYKRALIKAKEKTLPELFKEIKDLNEELATWMKAEIIPFKATAEKMKGTLTLLEERVFHVELYAGLIETVVQVKKGKSAPETEKLHVMQRRCCMDEECLIDYQAGGMNFGSIHRFDKWLSQKEHLERILPFPRCLAAFRVRRLSKDYESLDAFVSFHLKQADESTFLYIRNGESLYRLNTELEFGAKLFPDTAELQGGEKLWGKMFTDRIDEMVPDRLYQEMKREHEEAERLSEEWQKNHPEKDWFYNPHRDHSSFSSYRYTPFDHTSVYFDDMTEKLAEEAKQYNRIALIIQGLFDRSTALHPHPPVRIWDQDSFRSAIKLVYDGDRTLYQGEAPDFEAYRQKLNASLKTGSHTVGQDDYWQRVEARRENERRLRHGRGDDQYYERKRYKPYGNPGPGLIAVVGKYSPRVKKCLFSWKRDRYRYNRWGNQDPVSCNLSVPASELLCIDNYVKGDYKQFFNDPRTRIDYLKWAPLLLAAEDFLAGKTKRKKES